MQCVQVLMGKHEQISNKLRKQTIGIPSVKQACHTNYSLQVHISIIVDLWRILVVGILKKVFGL